MRQRTQFSITGGLPHQSQNAYLIFYRSKYNFSLTSLYFSVSLLQLPKSYHNLYNSIVWFDKFDVNNSKRCQSGINNVKFSSEEFRILGYQEVFTVNPDAQFSGAGRNSTLQNTPTLPNFEFLLLQLEIIIYIDELNL